MKMKKQKCNIKLNIFLAPLNLINCALKEYMVIKKKKKDENYTLY